MNMSTGKQIRHYRQKAKWKLEQLSDASGVDVGTISALEVRDSKRSQFFAAIAKAFGLSVEQLADESADYELVNLSDPNPIGSTSIQLNHAGRDLPYGWPFSERIKPWQYNELSQLQKEEIEKYVILQLNAREPPAEQIPPANFEKTGTHQ